jgi:hypothetical protein
MKAAIYTRISTADENPELQLREIQDHANRQGGEIVDLYQNIASGAKATRPGLNRLMGDARASNGPLSQSEPRPEGFGVSRITGPERWERPATADPGRICLSAGQSGFSTGKG